MNINADNMSRLLRTIRHCAPSETDAAWKLAADLLRPITNPTDDDVTNVCAMVLEKYKTTKQGD